MTKKLLVLVFVFVSILAMLSGCNSSNQSDTLSDESDSSSNLPNGNGDTSIDNDSGDTLSGYGKDYIKNHLGNNYSITFTVKTKVDNQTDTKTETMIVTEEGYYYISEANNINGQTNQENWFIRNSANEYDMWFRNSQGIIGRSSFGNTTCTEEDLQITLGMEFTYMSMYDGTGMAQFMEKSGTDTIAGRECDKYIYGGTYPYLIDKETGVCLKFTMATLTGGGITEYEVANFTVGGASLPAYN